MGSSRKKHAESFSRLPARSYWGFEAMNQDASSHIHVYCKITLGQCRHARQLLVLVLLQSHKVFHLCLIHSEGVS